MADVTWQFDNSDRVVQLFVFCPQILRLKIKASFKVPTLISVRAKGVSSSRVGIKMHGHVERKSRTLPDKRSFSNSKFKVPSLVIIGE